MPNYIVAARDISICDTSVVRKRQFYTAISNRRAETHGCATSCYQVCREFLFETVFKYYHIYCVTFIICHISPSRQTYSYIPAPLPISNCPVEAVPWLRSSVAGLSPRRSRFAPGSIHVRFVVDKVALGQVFLGVLRFYPVSIIPPSLSKLISSGECVICQRK
jgi:hypothetical protein